MDVKNILFILGPAGSGKSTQAELIAKELGYTHIVESDLLKRKIAKRTTLGRKIEREMREGILVPFEVTCDLLFNKINKTRDKKIIVDGFPREINQAITLDYYIYKQKYNIQAVIYVDTSKDVCIKRLLERKREDDTKNAIKKRLEIYFNETLPVIKRFKNKGLLIRINGNKSINEVNAEINKKLKK